MAAPPQDSLRHETVAFGIAGASLAQIERTVPADEAPPLPPNADLSQIGKPARRWNGVEKVTGAVRFTADVDLPRLLHARLLRAPFPHARIARYRRQRGGAPSGRARGARHPRAAGRRNGVGLGR